MATLKYTILQMHTPHLIVKHTFEMNTAVKCAYTYGSYKLLCTKINSQHSLICAEQ